MSKKKKILLWNARILLLLVIARLSVLAMLGSWDLIARHGLALIIGGLLFFAWKGINALFDEWL